MPPEGPGRPSGDVYSLGILLYELFTGKQCFDFPELPSALQPVEGNPQLLQVYKIVLKACEMDVRKRCQSAEELHRALNALLPEEKTPPSAGAAADVPERNHPLPVSGGPQGAPSSSSPKLVAIAYKAHTQPDDRLAEILRDRLTRHGHRVFLGREVKVGLHWIREIENKFLEADIVIVLLSGASQRSEMLAYEVEVARNAAARRGAPVLLPVRVAFSESLTEPLASMLNPLPACRWEGPPDDELLVNQLLRRLENPHTGATAVS